MDLKNLSSNWKKLQASGTLKIKNTTESGSLKEDKQTHIPAQQNDSLKRKRDNTLKSRVSPTQKKSRKRARMMSEDQDKARAFGHRNETADEKIVEEQGEVNSDRINEGLAKKVDIGKYLAIDCEMVGIGPNPQNESALARVSIVNFTGDQVYDSYVKPQEEVTDWRTHVSGIQLKHMRHARSFEEVQTDVASLIKGRIIVGHAVRNDFDALFLDHPKRDIRDTARHAPYRKLAGGGSPKLKILASELLGLDIQAGEHSSIEDARATMLLFRRDKDSFEKEHIKKWGAPVVAKKVGEEAPAANEMKKSKKKKKKKR